MSMLRALTNAAGAWGLVSALCLGACADDDPNSASNDSSNGGGRGRKRSLKRSWRVSIVPSHMLPSPSLKVSVTENDAGRGTTGSNTIIRL